MKKKDVENLASALPSFFKNSAGYLKSYFDENGQEILGNTSGTAGFLIKLFATPLIDKYFDKLSEKKLDNFGLDIYIKSSLIQANESLDEIKDKLDDSLSPDLIFNVLNKSIEDELTSFEPKDVLLIFQPKYHPAVQFVKKNFQRILRELNANPTDINLFVRHFNENIEARVANEFGDDYEEHLKRTETLRLKDNETAFLWDTVLLGKIGFKESEDLKYEETYGQWKKVADLREKEIVYYDDNEEKVKYEKLERTIKPIGTLIEEYFNRTPHNHLEEILFVIADFGKGKSVFMKHYASELAKQYLQTKEGYFPVYFNLRNFKNYSSEPKLGVISDYLETRYSVKIDDDYFQNKKFVFLVDSLDESGELNKRAIEKVIASVKSIQGIDKTKYKTNRIIITSRPFDEGLSNHLKEHKPYIIKNEEGRDIPYFISVYGFTKAQINDWLFETLRTFPDIEKIKASGFAKQIIDGIKKNQKIDIYEEMLENKTLSRSELRRPIFGYMIYQLIINNVDFLAVGKLGVYLSFLNLLTKEAKHINDVNYKVNLKEEFEFRNVLHATASLWAYKRKEGKQGALKKADICRVVEGKDSGETDINVLDRLKGQGLTEIQFLSHSYFGDNANVLHFQHQSFAEILLAEYYLKVFIKYALDEDTDMEEARLKLVLGEPTEQTVLFLKEMLRLLRETAANETTHEIIEKRKLLFPLMASLATKKHNRLFCNDIHYSWHKLCDIGENQTMYPQEQLESWCIDQNKLNKIIELAANILNSKNSYLPVKSFSKTALFNNEITEIQNKTLSSLTPNIDQWLALLVGNILYNDFTNKENPNLFNWDSKINFHHLFELIRSWNYAFNDSGPNWGMNLFIGINMQDNNSHLNLSHFDFDGIDFSYSFFNHISCWSTNWSRSLLNHCTFSDIEFITSLFFGTSIQDIRKINQPFYMSECSLEPGGSFFLLNAFKTTTMVAINTKMKKANINEFSVMDDDFDIFKTCSGFLKYGLLNSLFTIKMIKTWFEFENKKAETLFIKRIDEFKKYEVKKKKTVKKESPKKE